MTECNAIIEANNEIDKLKRENKKLNAVCVKYGFEMGRLEEENEQLKLDKQHSHQAMSRQEVRHKQFKDKVFDLIDEKIKEADEGFEQTYDSWYQGQIDALHELKKELQE